MGEFAQQTLNSGVVVIKPAGRLNMVAAPSLRKELHALVDGGNTRVVVDLSGTELIDSSGLGALISGLKVARQAGGDLRIGILRTVVCATRHLSHTGITGHRAAPPAVAIRICGGSDCRNSLRFRRSASTPTTHLRLHRKAVSVLFLW